MPNLDSIHHYQDAHTLAQPVESCNTVSKAAPRRFAVAVFCLE